MFVRRPAVTPEAAPKPFVLDADHLSRQREFSLRAFGPGKRTEGVLDHIAKESAEVRQDPEDLAEWVDIIILGFDGAWRAGWEPQAILDAILAKQVKNEARQWPDWRTADPDKAIEHVRPDEDVSLGGVVDQVADTMDQVADTMSDPAMEAVARIAHLLSGGTWSKVDIKIAYDEGEYIGATHMIVAYDDFDHANYPIYVMPGQDPKDARPTNGDRVDECYRFDLGWEFQSQERRAEHWEFEECDAENPDYPGEYACSFPKGHGRLLLDNPDSSENKIECDHAEPGAGAYWSIVQAPSPPRTLTIDLATGAWLGDTAITREEGFRVAASVLPGISPEAVAVWYASALSEE